MVFQREIPTLMKKNIYATLDLIKSLDIFKENVTKVLELTNIAELDGVTLKEKEEKIREQALILAGQCIAILLYNLSQSQEVLLHSVTQTQGWWHPRTRRHGYKKRQILTIGNVEVTLKLPYVVERRNERKGKRKSLHQGFYPFLRWLGMEEGLTPLVWSTIAKYGTISSSFETARSTLIDWGINISLKRIERLTYHFGKVGLSQRQSKLFNLKIGNLPTGKVLKDLRVVIAVDGGRTRIRINKKGRRNSQTNRHGFTGEWIEPKLLTIYAVDAQGKKIKTGEIPVTNDGTYENYQFFLEILKMHLVDLGISHAQEVLLIADGAEWIWKHIPPLLESLGLTNEIYQLIDFYHVTEHLQLFASAAFTQDAERKKWMKTAKKYLKKGKITTLIEEMTSLTHQASEESRKIMTAQINYLTKADSVCRLNYAKVSAKQMPIGSGAVESLIRQVVNLRLKGNGKFWLKNNALNHLTCSLSMGGWQLEQFL